MKARLATSALTAACALAVAAPSASALRSHGQLLHLVPGARGNTSQSSNWFGYNQGTLEKGRKLFHSIAGNWRVPTVSQHRKGQAESSSDWIGIGGGCVDSGCDAGDSTLIQTGTEQDVSSRGSRSYSAWWEVVPAPSITIRMRVGSGDRMHAAISEAITGANLWRITLRDLTRHKSFSKTVSYSSTHDTAEWIEETPLLIGTNAGFASLPNLSSPRFDHAKTNGKPAQFKGSERIQLINSRGKVIGTASRPDPDHDGFNACTWSRTCHARRRS